MARHTVSLRSTALASCSYDEDRATLDISFVNGRNYTYTAVPREVFEGLISAASPGRYFFTAIKGVYT